MKGGGEQRLRRTARNTGLPAAMAILAALAGCVAVNGPVKIGTDYPEVSYISPKNADGVQDALVVPATLVPPGKTSLQGWRVAVADAQGGTIRTVEAAFEPAKRGEAVERRFLWDGRADDGSFVPDGEYRVQVEAWDRKGNRGRGPALRVVVDDTPPSVELSCPVLLFSPNGDGRLDAAAVRQRNSSPESRWDGEILNAQEEVVRRLRWGGRLADFEWDGRTDGAAPCPDGVYAYTVASRDLAGNRASFRQDGITIDTRPAPVRLDSDLPSFSPNGDGKMDFLYLYPKLTRADSVVLWEVAIQDGKGQAVRIFAGRDSPPRMIVFDGKDDRGNRLPDGRYQGLLNVLYGNGDSPRSGSPAFTLDVLPPQVAVTAPYRVFSPDGDGRKDTLTVRQSTSVEKLWRATVVNSYGKVVKSGSWPGTLQEVAWDGTNDDGKRVPDGVYAYRVTSTDEAENVETVELAGIRVDTRPTPLAMRPVVPAFSPNGDSILDSMIFLVEAGQRGEIETWRLQMVRRDGSVCRTLTGDGSEPLPGRIGWNGRGENQAVEEGSYRAVLTVVYEKGNVAEARCGPFLLDITPPAVSLKTDPSPFTPDGDGAADTVSLSITAQDDSPIEDWAVQILDPTGREFHHFSGRGAPRPIAWDGRSRTGELVQSAEDYPVVVTVHDSLWNCATVPGTIPVGLLVLGDGDRLKIVVSSIYFKEYTADYRDAGAIGAERVARNFDTLDQLAAVLNRYAGYRVRLEGHAVMVYWDRPDRARVEQEDVLLPLSRLRAEVIRDALVQRGVSVERMTAAGYGGARPVVPHGDLENRWKNRRVEFILDRR